MKHITVEVSGSGREPVEINLEPGVTAGEILSTLQMEGYALINAPRSKLPTNGGNCFYNSEVLYPIVNNGARLIAKTYKEYQEPRLQFLLHALELVDQYPQCFRKSS